MSSQIQNSPPLSSQRRGGGSGEDILYADAWKQATALTGREGLQLVRCGPATQLQPRLPHGLHCQLSSMNVRVTRTVSCSSGREGGGGWNEQGNNPSSCQGRLKKKIATHHPSFSLITP